MPGYGAIADVGETLVELLRDGVRDVVGDDAVVLASPETVGSGDGSRLTVYLYQVTQNDHARNDSPRGVDGTSDGGDPLVLDLYYLLTAHPPKPGGGNGPPGGGGPPGDDESDPPGTDWTSRTRTQHRVLGRAMQVLHDNPVLRGSDLVGLDSDTELRVSLGSPAPESVSAVWATFPETPFQPSVSYQVSPVEIESTREAAGAPVLERTVESYSWASGDAENDAGSE